MFSKEEYKSHFLGCFEVMLFMRAGVNRFSDTKFAAIRSFIWPLVLIPFALFSFSFHFKGHSLAFMMLLQTARILASLFLSLGVVYLFCRQFERLEHFYQYVTASNWMSVPIFLLILPAFISMAALATGWSEYESHAQIVEIYGPYAIFTTILWYIYTAFMITHILRVPWEAAGAVTILGLGIDQSMTQFMELFQRYFGF